MNHELLTIIFFGSFQSYSVQVLEELTKHFQVTAVITTPPQPAGRHLKLTPTAVQVYAQKHHLPVYPLEHLDTIPVDLAAGRRGSTTDSALGGLPFRRTVTALAKKTVWREGGLDLDGARTRQVDQGTEPPDFLVVAGYGKLIPPSWITFPKIMPINLHPSLLPLYRGRCPVEWAIINGETQTGVTLVKMSEEFDKGEILAQKAISITPTDTRESLYTKLYDLGARLLLATLPQLAAGRVKPKPQPPGKYFYARQITREDGFETWQEIEKARETGQAAERIERKFRALHPWPGLWTEVKLKTEEKKRLKIMALSVVGGKLLVKTVQLEGKKPVPFSQFVEAYL